MQSPTAFSEVDYDPFAAGELVRAAPATEAQLEVWMSSQMDSEASCAYNESITLRCRGRFDVAAMRAALDAVVARHEALHTTFSPDGLTLCVGSSTPLDVPLHDLTVETDDQRATEVAALLHREVETPFDLEHGPLFRASIVRLGDEEHLVVLTAHHIVCDGWSFAVVFKDLGPLYSAFAAKKEPKLEPVHRFTDYARDEREVPSDEAYWLGVFAETPLPVLDLPLDRPRPPLRGVRAGRLDRVLSPALVAATKKVGARHGCSFFVTLFAAFSTLLHRLSGQRDLVIGIPTAGQSVAGKEMLVGHCANLLPLRTKLDPDQRFSEYLKVARRTVLDAYDHQRTTFGSVLKKLPIARDPSRLPLVSVVFNLDTGIEGTGLRFEGLDVEFASNPRTFETFEIFLNVMETPRGVVLECQYSADLYDDDTIASRMASFETLLGDLAKNPETPIAKLRMVSEAEAKRLLVDWNDTAFELPRTTLHRCVEDQARRTPSRIAVTDHEQSLRYDELDAKANRLAQHLVKVGVTPGALVGLAVHRSANMVVGALAILKAGGAYVPVDREYPSDRISHMLADSKAKVVVTDRQGELPPCDAHLVYLDGDPALLEAEGTEAPVLSVASDDLAYVIYTSGSTGVPKGVAIPHGAVVNLLASLRRTPGLGPDDVVLALTTLSFDIAVLELFLPLSVGARTVIVPREVALDGAAILQIVKSEHVTLVQATPSTWRMLLAAGWQEDTRIRALCGGEALPRDLAADLLQRASEVWNLYGPTETCVWSTAHRLIERDAPVLIGFPIGNTRVYVLDASMQPVPLGVPGELYIGGAGVARGYVGKPELTRERFVRDPFVHEAEARLYRTGDLVRWRSTGGLEFLRRNDDQVKVRGFRIELGEIETVLRECAGVADGVVGMHEERAGDVRLVAYAVAASGAELTLIEVRAHLRKKLPDYMLPQALMLLERLPRTPNGKVDRKSLPSPTAGAEVAPTHVAPRTPLETALAKAFAELLGCSPSTVSVETSFFDLGGHSLLVTQLVSRIRDELAVELRLRTVYEAPTVAAIAQHVEALRYAQAPVRTGGSEDREEFEI
jgi:amino acid adenylation domain-containing protein